MNQALALKPVRLWRAHPRETVAFAAVAAAGMVALAGTALSTPQLPGRTAAAEAPPAPPPLLLRAVPAQQALTINQGIPLQTGPNPAALPFRFKGNAASRTQALDCLASAVYYEAGSQDENGQRAVAQVVLNRVRNVAFPSSVCGVVYQGSTRSTGCQFTFTCDGSLERRPDSAGWARASRVAQAALAGAVFAPVGLATHYHADYVLPYWASTLAKNAVVGAHIFYRWAGGWGQPAAFAKAYAASEPNAGALRMAALSAEHSLPASASQPLAAEVAQIPGAELKKPVGGRVSVRFNMAEARKAVEQAPHREYVETFQASPNLKYLLGTEAVAQDKPLGKAAAAASGGGTATASPQ